MICFDYTPNQLKYIKENIIFNEPKKEEEVFNLILKGYNNIEIGMKIGMSDKSVYRRKKDIQKKISQIL